MIYGIYESAAGLQLNQYQMELLANNLANASTPGFKHDLAVVRERQIEAREGLVDPSLRNPVLDGLSGGSFVAPTYTSFEQGPVEKTGGNLDVALVGDGFFAVQDGDAVRYTRDGRFALNNEGELVTVAGNHKVLDESGQSIVVPKIAASEARITDNGDIQSGDAVYGRIAVTNFDDTNKLRKVGSNMIEPVGAEKIDPQASLRSGFIEGSTVDPMKSMVSMMQVTRAYEMNAKLVGLADSTLGKAVNDVARLK